MKNGKAQQMWMVVGPGGCLAVYYGIQRTRKELKKLTEPLPPGSRMVRVWVELAAPGYRA